MTKKNCPFYDIYIYIFNSFSQFNSWELRAIQLLNEKIQLKSYSVGELNYKIK